MFKKWSKKFCDEDVIFIKGDLKGEKGVFERVAGYTSFYGAICKVYIESIGESWEFTSDFFQFIDEQVQEKWNH